MEDHTRKTNKERLKNDDRYFHILQSIPDAILLTRTGDSVVLDINNAFEKLTGYGREEVLGRTCEQLPFFPKPGFWTQAFKELEATGEVREIETSIFRKDGRIACVLISSRSVEVDGESCRLNIIRDITEQKQAEALLWESEQRMRQKLDTILSPETDIGKLELADVIDARMIQSLMDDFHKLTHIPMAIVDLEGRVLVGVGWEDICVKFHRVHPETCSHCVESDTQLTAGVRPGEFSLYKCRNNMWDIATPLIVGNRHIGNIFSGQFFFDNEPLDYELFRSQARQYGFDEQAYMAALETVQRLSRETVNTGMTFLMKLAHMISQLSYSNIKLVRSLAERNDLMGSLQESEQLLNATQELAKIGGWNWSADTNTTTWTDETYRIHDVDKQEYASWATEQVEKTLAYYDPENRPVLRAAFQRCIQEGQPYDLEFPFTTEKGRRLWIRTAAQPVIRDGKIVKVVGHIMDITDRRQAEDALQKAREELIRAEKLSILGRLAGMVAHEIRNPLGVMNNAVYFLKTIMTNADDIVKEYLDIIKHEIDNSQRIITDLLDFARTKTPQIVPVIVNTLITKALGRCIIPENIIVETDIPDTLPKINVDPFQIAQVLLNLITNAVQAMPEGGSLRIRARQGSGIRDQGSGMEELEPDPRPPTADPGSLIPDPGYVEITVTDTGEGISEENTKKLFQPLFTTKTKGIGLGLTMCKNLTEANGGRIEVESQLGIGATVTITIPVSGKEA